MGNDATLELILGIIRIRITHESRSAVILEEGLAVFADTAIPNVYIADTKTHDIK